MFFGLYNKTREKRWNSSVESHSISYRFSIYYGIIGEQQCYLLESIEEYIHNNLPQAYHVSEYYMPSSGNFSPIHFIKCIHNNMY